MDLAVPALCHFPFIDAKSDYKSHSNTEGKDRFEMINRQGWEGVSVGRSVGSTSWRTGAGRSGSRK